MPGGRVRQFPRPDIWTRKDDATNRIAESKTRCRSSSVSWSQCFPIMSKASQSPIRFVDLARQQERIRDRIDAAIARTLDHGQYIMGPEIGELESALAAFCGARHAVAVSSGTDALALVLMAKEVKPGDADLLPRLHLRRHGRGGRLARGDGLFRRRAGGHLQHRSAARSKTAIAQARRAGHRPVGIISVDLFGLPADYAALEKMAESEGLWLLCGRRAKLRGELPRPARRAPAAT